MDHVLALSTELLRLLSPLITQGALAEVGATSADRTQQLARRAWAALQRSLGQDAEASSAMTLFQAAPDKASRRDLLAELIAERLAGNSAAIAELQELVAQLRPQGDSPTSGRTHNQHIGDNAQVGVAVAGDVHGPITNQSGGINFGSGNSIGTIGDIVAGDKVAGDKVLGDKITTGDITHSSGVAIGRNAQATSRALPPPTDPAADGAVEPRAINVWVGDQRDTPTQLMRGRTRPLHFQIGDPARASLVFDAPAARVSNDVPADGLPTSWTVMARDVRLEAPPDQQVEVDATPGETEAWVARFDLLVPQQGESEQRTLLVTPLRAGVFTLDVLIQVRGVLYRQFQVTLDATQPAVLSDPESAPKPVPLVTRDVVHTRADQIGLHSPHEWQSEPGVLRLTVIGNQALVDADLAMVDAAGATSYSAVRRLVEWSVTARNVEGLIANVRAAADTFRAVRAHESYLNDIDAADLAARLAAFQPEGNWAALPNAADPAHATAWESVRGSKELRALAKLGYQLYNRFFPGGGTLRPWLDALIPGHRVNITWTASDAGWMPAVPWGLMYNRDPGTKEPIDPMAFLGLRFRIDYTGYASQGAPTPKHLGRPDQAHCGHLMYWGGQANDATASEAAWQRGQLAGLPLQIFAPSEVPGTDRKQELLALLEQTEPRPMALLYLFCQCDLNDGANLPLLRFGSTRDDANILGVADLPLGQLPDRSLVFANACTTVAGTTTLANELPQHFFDRGCSAFLGTEVRVPIAFASRFAAIFFHFFYRLADQEHQPMAAGEAVAQTRLFLWSQYRNIGGILYTYINQYELFLADEQEIRALLS